MERKGGNVYLVMQTRAVGFNFSFWFFLYSHELMIPHVLFAFGEVERTFV